jgi:hypothetical protein
MTARVSAARHLGDCEFVTACVAGDSVGEADGDATLNDHL